MSAGYFRLVLAALLTAIAVKMLDDFLDAAPEERTPWTFPYGAAALVVAGALAPQAASALFLASYAVGMFGRPGERLPSGLPAWAESAVAAGLALGLAGWRLGLAALAGVLAIQCWDDVMDSRRDALVGQANLARRFGTVETAVGGTALGVVAALVHAGLWWAAAISAALIWSWEKWRK